MPASTRHIPAETEALFPGELHTIPGPVTTRSGCHLMEVTKRW